MVPLPKNYTDEDAAAAITYVYNTWGNPGGVVTVAEVKAARKK
jgi:mono/diheme cytochrome c family protein